MWRTAWSTLLARKSLEPRMTQAVTALDSACLPADAPMPLTVLSSLPRTCDRERSYQELARGNARIPAPGAGIGSSAHAGQNWWHSLSLDSAPRGKKIEADEQNEGR